MSNQTIMIIRHAEKPVPGEAHGIDETGAPDKRSLTARGWQRAGAWAELFVPSLGGQSSLPTPTALFASAPSSDPSEREEDGTRSRRPLETLTPLAEKLGAKINLDYTKGQESALAQAISKRAEVVLVCWQHEDVIPILQALKPAPAGIPAKWPGDRFNILIRLDRTSETAPWVLKQIAPVMLSGDKTTPL